MIELIKNIFWYLFDITILKEKVKKGQSVGWIDLIISPSIRYAIIIGLLLGIAMSIFRILTVDYFKTQDEMKHIHEIKSAIIKYEIQTGNYPISLNKLIGNRPLRKNWQVDKWNQPLIYTIFDTGFELKSLGVDGVLNTEDDIIVTN